MSKKIFFILFTLSVSRYQHGEQKQLSAIGKPIWLTSDVQEIEQVGNLIFIQASNDLYVYNKDDQSIQTFSKS